MKSKLKFLIKNNLNKKIKTKWFKIVNIILLIAIAGLINIDTIVKSFGGDFDNEYTIYVNSKKETYDNFNTAFNSLAATSTIGNYKIEYTTESEKLKKDINEDNQNIIINLNEETSVISSEIVSYETIDSLTYQIIESTLNSIKTNIYLENTNLSIEEKAELSNPIKITNNYINSEIDEYASAKETLGSVLIPILIVPVFMLIVLLVQFIGADVNEEKTTRSMEIIISSVPPKIHFFSKIIGSTAFVLFQGILLLVYGTIGILIRNYFGNSSGEITNSFKNILEVLKSYGVIDNLIPGLIIILLIFLISFIAYSLLAGILASMTTSLEDYQQLQGPIMIISVVGYYLAIMASVFQGSIFIKVASYIPFISTLLSPILFILGQATIYDMLISLTIMGVVVYLLFKYGLRVYKIGILNYSSKDLWKKVFKSIKN